MGTKEYEKDSFTYPDLDPKKHSDSAIEATIVLLGKRVKDAEFEIWELKSELKNKEKQIQEIQIENNQLRNERDTLKKYVAYLKREIAAIKQSKLWQIRKIVHSLKDPKNKNKQ